MAKAQTRRKTAHARSPVEGDLLGAFFSQNQILRGAAEVFRDRGIAAATVEDILRAAGVSRRTFYKAFQNKEDVLVALHRGLSELFLSAMRRALDDARSPLERAKRSVDILLFAAQRADGLFLAIQAEALRPDSRLWPRRQEIVSELYELFLAAAERDGREKVDPLLFHGVMAANEAVLRTLMKEGKLDEARIERARRVMLRVMITSFARAGEEVPPLPRWSEGS
jgi:AcrR family transcriptional regulator